MDTIKDGHFIIIQRNNYLRVQKFNLKKPIVKLGKESGNRPRTIDFSAIDGKDYESIFKMVPDEKNEQGWRLEAIEDCNEIEEFYNDDCSFEGDSLYKSGEDNRNLTDENRSQELTREDIESMQEQRMEGSKIIERLVENSASFDQKTKFSQEKFLKKKSKKYCQYIKIRRPSIRLLMQIRNSDIGKMKTLNLRIDSLAQLMNNCNVRSGGKYMIYDTTSQGLIVATALERIITDRVLSPEPCLDRENMSMDATGKIVHLYFTGNPQTQCLGEMNYSDEVLSAYLSTLNMFHLRSLEQGVDIVSIGKQEQMNRLNRKRKYEYVCSESKNGTVSAESGSPSKETCSVFDNDNTEEIMALKVSEGSVEMDGPSYDEESTKELIPTPYRQKMREDSNKSYNIIKQKKMDGLIISSKQHPTSILLHLIPYLAPSRPFVVFSSYKEPLMDAYFAVKETGKTVFVTLTETWLRNYQVLPDRTHPEVLMSGGGGYILSGLVVDNSDPPACLPAENNEKTVINGKHSERKNKRFRRK